MVEQYPYKVWVGGSSPSRPTKHWKILNEDVPDDLKWVIPLMSI